MVIILLSGKKECGKTTIANYIKEKYNFKIYNLADKLKEITFDLLKYFNYNITELNDLYDINTKKQYRKHLQYLGTDIFRKHFGEDFWCEQLYKQINENENYIIGDIRFLNEKNYFKDSISIKIIRPELNNIEDNHISEQIDFECDYTIYNNETLTELYDKIDLLMNNIL